MLKIDLVPRMPGIRSGHALETRPGGVGHTTPYVRFRFPKRKALGKTTKGVTFNLTAEFRG